MYIIKVLDKATGEFVHYTDAGKFSRKERAEGALTMLERLGETRAMKVELVNPGVDGTNKGRTEHGAALASKVQDPERLAQLRSSIAKAREVKAAKRAATKEEAPVSKSSPPVALTAGQVAQLISSIIPGKPGSGEYLLELDKLVPLAKVG